MLSFGLAILAGLGGSAWAAPRAIIDSDFGTGENEASPTNERASGLLPTGWTDDTAWCNTWVDYAQREEEGRRFTRVSVTRVDDGWGQVRFTGVPRIETESFFRLTFTARSFDQAAVQMHLRDSGPPYRTIWETRPALGSGWRDYAYDFRLAPYENELGFFLTFSAVASADLVQIRLVQLTEEDYIEEMRAAHPDGGPSNLLRNSRLPLGLQSGWSLDRDRSDGDEVVLAPDPDAIGPSGFPALRVDVPGPTRLWSEPFGVPLAFERHTASLYARGSGEIALEVVADGAGLGAARIGLDPGEWRRIELPFQPPLMSDVHGLQLTLTDECWVDAFQINTGDVATPYTSQMECEVALALTDSDAAIARVLFDDEPALCDYAVTGGGAGAQLCAQVVDPYGEPRPLGAQDVGGEAIRYGEIDLAPEPSHAYGPMRVEAWVEREGERISPFAELVLYRLPRPRHWGEDAPGSAFGVHTNSTTRHNTMAKAIGANWVRLHDAGLEYIGWWWLEPERGTWAFRDEAIQRYRDSNLKILAELGTAPQWASYMEAPHNGYFDRFYQPRDLADYANYCRTVAERYKGLIDAWDVWNEPWIESWWAVKYDDSKEGRGGYVTSEEPQRDFVGLMRTAYETVKAVDPAMIVCGFNTTNGRTGGDGRRGGYEWTAGVLEHGGLPYCDQVVYHHYTSGQNLFPGDTVEEAVGNAVGPIIEQQGAVGKPVWMTEGSPTPGSMGVGFYNHTLPSRGEENIFTPSDDLARYMVSTLANGVDKLFLYSMHAHTYFPGGQFRALVTPEGYLHPSAAAHAICAWRLEDTQFLERVDLSETLSAYVFEGDGRAVAVLSPGPGHEATPLPSIEGAEARDLFGNPLSEGAPLARHLIYLTTDGSGDELAAALRAS